MRASLFLVIAFIIQSQNSICQDLDLTFNTTGISQIQIGTSIDECKSMALDNNGKIVIAGYSLVSSKYQFSVARLTSSGQLDATFDTDGKIIIPLGTSYGESASCMTIQSDNKIYVAGYYSTATDYELGVIKLNTDGSLDNAFDSDGKLLLQVTTKNDYATDMAVQSSDNKIIVVGSSSDSLFVIRLNTDGSIDNSFDTDGKVFFDNFGASSVFIQADGKILITGNYNNDVAVVRLNSDGSFDTSFDTDGVATIDFGSVNDKGNDIIVLASGKLLVGGGDGFDFIAVRLNADGSLDNTFDSDGKFSTSFSNTDVCYSVSEDNTTNDIILAGYTFNLVKGSNAICRLSSTGTIEAKAVIPIGSGNSEARSTVVQSDRKVVIAGSTDIGTGNDDFAVIRLVADFVTTESLNSENVNIGINLFPNPANYHINIHSTYSIQQVQVIDILGNEVLNRSAYGNLDLDISMLPKGLYNFVITTDKGIGSKKVSIQ